MSSTAEMPPNGHIFDKKLSIPIEVKPSFSSEGELAEEELATRTPADEGLRFFQSEVSGSEQPIRVYELKLEPDGGPSKDKAYIRLPPAVVPYVLRLTLDAGTPASRRAILKTNFPLDGGLFDRNKFVGRKLPDLFSNPIHIDIPISHAGAFRYWIEYENDACKRVDGREGYFNVDPVLRTRSRTSILSGGPQPRPLPDGGVVQTDEISLPLDGIVVLTTVSKWMGPVTEWRCHFREASDRGYNMLHYTPLQQAGVSGSPYSIADQMNFDRNITGDTSQESSLSKVQKILKVARDEFGLLSLIDIVLNHTANNTLWLLEHPEAGYSPYNTPHLAPALELDNAIMEFSSMLGKQGLPSIISSPADLETLMHALERKLREEVQLWQYYVLNRSRERDNIANALNSSIGPWDGPELRGKSVEELANILKSNGNVEGLNEYKARYHVHVDSSVAASFIRSAFPDIHDIENLADTWTKIVDVINVPLYQEWEEDTRTSLQNIRNRLEYTRLADHGPKLGEINAQSPLVDTYFTRLSQNEITSKFDPKALALANNGWIWDADPLSNFALLPSKAYLRREVIVWGDCVKLRYGAGPEDNPWLWEYMENYVVELARNFDGFRIDNCHSTPLHVGVAFLDAARVVNPNLYICAELFTGNEEMDVHFVSRLGINSLIREAYNGHDPKEFSRLLYRFGVDRSIGSMHGDCLTSIEELPSPTGKGPVRTCIVSPLRGSSPHALFFDLTHDNESPLFKRSSEDALSTGALVAFSGSAIGSTKGFDDLYPKLLDLVGEKRLYEVSGIDNGIGKAKRILNHLHTQMVLEGHAEGYVHQENDYINIHRINPQTGSGYLLIAHTAFNKGNKDRGYVGPTKLARTAAKFIFGASIEVQSYEIDKDPELIRGLPSKLVELQPVVPLEGNADGHLLSEIIIPDYFPPGSFMLFATQLQGFDPTLDTFCKSGAEDAFNEVSLIELNTLLYRSEAEERDATGGKYGTYHIPNYGNLVYSGLEGWMSVLRKVIENNDLGHPICDHLRSGTWACDYVYARLENQIELLPGLAKPAKWFKEKFSKIIDTAPPFLLPKYFAIVIYEGYKAARSAVIEQSASFVSTGYSFVHDLALCSVQMHGLVKTASIDPSRPVPSLAAGLPHFAVSWARCWGRDVFISLRGLFLVTGQYPAAKSHILAFASTLKHGLIPNLLDSVRNPRYNSRDSPWWMLQNIQDYVHFAPEGLNILSELVKRRFPPDDSFVSWDDSAAYSRINTLAEIIQEILQRHALGISFREHNAGPNLDMQMNDEGFNIDINVDWSTGFISGGNKHNCGTWMDKMGESVKAGTKGKPGTPRDGAPVEIIGLLKSTVRWLSTLAEKDLFPFKGVEAIINGQKTFVAYKEWDNLIQSSFERHYYIPTGKRIARAKDFHLTGIYTDPKDDANYIINTNLVNRRGIYKDVYGSGGDHEWADYQLRPNYPIAMTVAPELFEPSHALAALKVADQVLRGPLGMKTLDPSDWAYRGIYDNSNDSDDPTVAKGFNYHNGPEWMWPMGYFLRAYYLFDTLTGSGKKDRSITLHYLHSLLLPLRKHIQVTAWRGLPELTNENGAFCKDSCPTQAWSSSSILDFLHDVYTSEANTDALQKEKEKFLQHGSEEEKLAVFNWGESDYDGLGEALQEGGDELNEETFGDSGPIGKDFDFTKSELTGFEKERFISQFQPEGVGSLPQGKRSKSGISELTSTPSGGIWHDNSANYVPPNTRRVHAEYQSTAPGRTITPSAAHNAAHPTAASTNHVRTLEEIEAELLKQRPSQPAYQASVVSSGASLSSSQPQDYTGYEPQNSTSNELEHQLRMMHLNQLQHLQANRQDQLLLQQQLQTELFERQQQMQQMQQQQLQEHLLQEQLHRIQLRQLEELEQQERIREMQRLQKEQLEEERLIRHVFQRQQQQSPLYQTNSHPRQVRTPDQFGVPSRFQRSFPNTPEPQLPPSHVSQQNYLTLEQRNQLQIQQQMLLQLSQAGVSPDQIHLLDSAQREAIVNETRRKIQAAEQLDQRNRRRLAKMERMARYNDLMTQSDKDFITRIQVSQLVTSDPYAEDFYAQVLGSLRRGNVKWFGNSGVGQRLSGRREHAMHRMAEQVYRIVENAKAREKEKGQNGVHPLQGVLGKTSGRSYKAAPRQLLQVEAVTSPSPTSSPRLREQQLQNTSPEDVKQTPLDDTVYQNIEVKDPLTYRQALAIIENLFDYTIEWETNRRFIPEENTEDYEHWLNGQKAIEAKMWEASQINAPLDGRYPHPLVSILTPLKGKKVLKRIIRVMDARQLRITLTLVTRLFRDFDVIQDYHVTESLVDTKEKQETERHIHAFEEYVLEPLLPALAVAPLPFVSGQLHLLTDPVAIARTRPGIILLTHIFTRAAVIKDRTLTFQAGGATDGMIGEDIATAEEFQQWQTCFDNLFQLLAPHFLSFFPSIRIIASLPFAETQLQNSLALDAADQPVWGFFAAMAVPANIEQQGMIVTQLREKVLEIVLRIQQGWIVDENERELKLRNINSFLHAIGLDSSQINL